ncbi:MAG: beta-galactosidase [Lachnospiraceae bacterium]|nr:beta-galactosidase [Lachnospiraceae bacterium]
MERGIYFDGWYKHEHCYHPSLPMRSLQMLKDLEDYHGTVLCWAGMGGGSISLPYLWHEAFDPVDPRMQVYGFMNDSEFVAECNRRGIKLFGIVFEVQGWEYPAVFDDNGKLIKMNRRAEDSENADWYGLREFSSDKHKEAFSTSLKDYYPEGIKDEDGNIVNDLWEECCIRDRFGNPVHAQWVEVKDHKESCYQMCRNNPVWRSYLKKIMEIQIDAGVPGIQLDECELPMTAISSGGCFCKSCMKQFTAYIKEKKNENKLGAEWDNVDLDNFDYGKYLIANNCSYPENAPFFRDYWEFQVWQVRKYFSELADHARAYAKEKYGREIQVSGNFYNMQPAYYPIENKVDIVITEMEHTLFKQPYYYRYCAGFAREKTVIIAENPYGGIIPRLLELLDSGRGYDLYRIFLLEASMYGCNMSVPYGSWMGNTIRDAFWAPKQLTKTIQDFLYEHEECYPKTASTGAAVLYSYGSYYWRDSNKGSGANGMQDAYGSLLDATASEWLDPDMKPVPFWDVIRALSERNVQYDVVMMPDGVYREDDFTLELIKDHPLVVVPDCHTVTENQQRILLEYAEEGGRLLIAGRLAEGSSLVEELKKSGNAEFVPVSDKKEEYMPQFIKAFMNLYEREAPLLCDEKDLGVQRYDKDGVTYVHLLNYRYDESEDRVLPIEDMELTLRDVADSISLITPEGIAAPGISVNKNGNETRVSLKNTGLYTVLRFGG